MSGGRRPYDKGRRLERELAALLGGQRVPLSGAAGGVYAGDVKAWGLTWEVKARRDGFRQLYRWLDGKDALAVKADRRPWLVILPLATFQRLIGRGEGRQAG